MTNIYKIVVNNKVSNQVFLASKAKKLVKFYKSKGFEAKAVLYKKNVKIMDMPSLGIVQYYLEEQVDNG